MTHFRSDAGKNFAHIKQSKQGEGAAALVGNNTTAAGNAVLDQDNTAEEAEFI